LECTPEAKCKVVHCIGFSGSARWLKTTTPASIGPVYDCDVRISIANPCSERLQDFGYCERCQQTVHDLSKLTRSEALELYYANGQKLCVRLTRDPNGQVEFRPEPPSALGRFVRTSLVGLTMAGGAVTAQNCAVEVRVMDESGAGLANARVTLSGAAEVTGKTDSLGVFRQEIASGGYAARAEAQGFASWTREITCEESLKIEAVLQVGSVGGGTIIDPVPMPIRKTLLALNRLFRFGKL
jgi:hypothetical protein